MAADDARCVLKYCGLEDLARVNQRRHETSDAGEFNREHVVPSIEVDCDEALAVASADEATDDACGLLGLLHLFGELRCDRNELGVDQADSCSGRGATFAGHG